MSDTGHFRTAVDTSPDSSNQEYVAATIEIILKVKSANTVLYLFNQLQFVAWVYFPH